MNKHSGKTNFIKRFMWKRYHNCEIVGRKHGAIFLRTLKPMPTTTRMGTCPHCDSRVKAEWKRDTICLQPWCEKCDRFLLEDEVDWDEWGNVNT